VGTVLNGRCYRGKQINIVEVAKRVGNFSCFLQERNSLNEYKNIIKKMLIELLSS
jgi:hypothetical protein